MAEETLLRDLHRIAKTEGISLGEVIRQGLEWRVRTRNRVPSFIGKLERDDGPTDTARRADDYLAGNVRTKHARR